jgi:hypothetical protein
MAAAFTEAPSSAAEAPTTEAATITAAGAPFTAGPLTAAASKAAAAMAAAAMAAAGTAAAATEAAATVGAGAAIDTDQPPAPRVSAAWPAEGRNGYAALRVQVLPRRNSRNNSSSDLRGASRLGLPAKGAAP